MLQSNRLVSLTYTFALVDTAAALNKVISFRYYYFGIKIDSVTNDHFKQNFPFCERVVEAVGANYVRNYCRVAVNARMAFSFRIAMHLYSSSAATMLNSYIFAELVSAYFFSELVSAYIFATDICVW